SRLMREIAECQKKDQRCKKGFLNEETGMWTFHGAIIVPERLEKDVIYANHDGLLQGHAGEARTVERIQRNYYFPGMTRKVRKYIKRCEDCQKNREDHHRPYGKMKEWQHELKRPWQHITMDFMTGLPETTDPMTKRKVDQILVVVDRFSKQTILIPTWKTITTEEVIELLWKYVFSVFGTPQTITSDRDKLFRSEKWKETMKELIIESTMSTAEHQQTDGQSERKIQEIQQYLRNFLDFTQRNWIQLLPKAQYALNDAYNSVTELTPNQVVFGRESSENWSEQTSETTTQRKERMESMYKAVGQDIQWKRGVTKNTYDKRRKDAPTLEEGDRVYVRRRNFGQKKFHLKTRRTSSKLDNLKMGPFRIE